MAKKNVAKKKVAKKTKPLETPQEPNPTNEVLETPPEPQAPEAVHVDPYSDDTPRAKPVKLIDSLVNTVDPEKLKRAARLKITVPPNVSEEGLDALIKLAEIEQEIPEGAEIDQMAVTSKTSKGFFVRVDPHKAVRLLEGRTTNNRGQEIWETISAIMPAGAKGIFVKKEKGYVKLRLKVGGKVGPVIQKIEL